MSVECSDELPKGAWLYRQKRAEESRNREEKVVGHFNYFPLTIKPEETSLSCQLFKTDLWGFG
jgi:hypothetical protein